jgi:hypothetical protein
MTRKIYFVLLISLFLLVLLPGIINTAHTNNGGAPAGFTGSPSDGASCTHCHGGSAAFQAGWITSDIPSTGYIPGTTYTITATVTSASRSRFGFQISPQRTGGALAGTMTLTNPAQTQLLGGGKYITHTASGTSGSGSKSWTFNWTAPAAGTGSVTFYGAFNGANNNGNSLGDIIYRSTMGAQEDTGVGITENREGDSPVYSMNYQDGRVSVRFNLKSPLRVSLSIYDIQGRRLKEAFNEMKEAGRHEYELDLHDLSPGLYIVNTEAEGRSFARKITVSK